jgi:hypothetical protein
LFISSLRSPRLGENLSSLHWRALRALREIFRKLNESRRADVHLLSRFDYSGPRAQGPQIAQVMPLPALLPPKRFTNSVLPSGLKHAPANSLSLSRFTANSNGSPKPPMPIKRLTSLIPGAGS